jgi:hypothetical protein
MSYRVGRSWGDTKVYMSATQAKNAALKLGDPVVIWRHIRNHWHIVADRSALPGQARPDLLPIDQHLSNVFASAVSK